MPKPMTMDRALRLAQKKYGKNAIVQDKGRKHGPSSPDQRATASALLMQLRAAKPVRRELHEWPREATVGEVRDHHRQHRVEYDAWKLSTDAAFSDAMYYRYEVLEDKGWAAQVQGSGDTWEEALQKAGCPTVFVV